MIFTDYDESAFKELSQQPPAPPSKKRRKVDHAIQSGTHPHAERGEDFYETPRVAVEALLANVGKLPSRIWEPAAGNGAICKVLKQHGYATVASDIMQRDYPLDYVGDFLTMKQYPNAGAIVTNPPFLLAAEFVRQSLRWIPEVHLLLRLAFIESEARSDILDHGKLKAVRVFTNRLPFMHRDSWSGKRNTSSSICFAWFSWHRDHDGPAELTRIKWIK